MTHPPQEILIKVMCSERLPSEDRDYMTNNGISEYSTFLKMFDIRDVTHWYEPATRIVLTVEELQVIESKAKKYDELERRQIDGMSLTNNPTASPHKKNLELTFKVNTRTEVRKICESGYIIVEPLTLNPPTK